MICFTLLGQNYLLIKIFFVLNYIIYIISYLYTILKNPGIPERKFYIKFTKDNKTKDFRLKCKKCNIIVPKNYNITHCSDCDICVREQDHHCPWTGKCIAKYNLKSFYVFTYSLLGFLINIFLTLYCNLFYRNGLRKKK